MNEILLRKITLQYAFCGKIATFPEWEKFQVCGKNLELLSENLLFQQHYSSENLQQTCYISVEKKSYNSVKLYVKKTESSGNDFSTYEKWADLKQ